MSYRFKKVVLCLFLLLASIGMTLGTSFAESKPALAGNCTLAMNFVYTYVTVPANTGTLSTFTVYNGLSSVDGSVNDIDANNQNLLYQNQFILSTGSTTYEEAVGYSNILLNASQTGYVILTYC